LDLARHWHGTARALPPIAITGNNRSQKETCAMKKKNLKLHRETLATLAKDALADVAGANGAGHSFDVGCLSRAVCPPTLPLCVPSIKASCMPCA
jgi:hypothetical protein